MAYTTINKPNQYFNTIIYTGDGASPRSLTGVGFKPDLVYIRNRDQAGSWAWYDAVRGTGASKNFSTDSTGAEGSGGDAAGYGFLSAFNTDGFSVTTGSVAYNIVNQSTIKYVAWNWLASNTTTSNTSGTISSTVSVNQTAGFSIVSYTGTGANATIGHGLGAAPKMVICKTRSTSADWYVYHASMGTNKNIYLNTNGASTTSNLWWNNTAPTSTVFSVGDQTGNNGSGITLIAYCFAEIRGYSKFSSYTGNGSTNGTFIYTGFKPAFVLIKSSSSAENWHIFDDMRNTFNPADKDVRPNTNGAETTSSLSNIDFLSNGFKLRNSDADYNGSVTTYIYMAFAENPFVSSTLIPTTAR